MYRPPAAGLLPALLVLVPAAAAGARGLGAEPPVTVTAAARPAAARPGEKVTLLVTAEIAEEFHIYGLPPVPAGTYATRIRVESPDGITAVGAARGPEPEIHRDPTLGGEGIPWYRGTVTFEQDVRIPDGARPGPHSLTVKLDQMPCTEELCLDPGTIEVPVEIEVLPGTAAPPPAGPTGDGSLLFLLWASFLGGLGSLALPCVYPLIPLTVAFFSKHVGTRSAAVTRALLFCAGIVVTFTVLGVAIGGTLQNLAGSLGLNLFLFLLMVILALSLFGMFDLRLPASWTGRLQAAGAGAGALAPLFMGFAFSLASFTCTVGIIGPLLAGGLEAGGARVVAEMLAYSVGFALPFFVLALFPAAVTSLPKGGGWMNTLKVLLGFFEVCFAGYYLWRVDLSLGLGLGTWPVILSLWIATILVGGFYLLGRVRLPHDPESSAVSVPRMMGAVVFFAFALYLLAGLVNQVTLPGWIQGLLPPRAPAFAAGGGGGPREAAAPRPDFADETFHPGHAGLWWTADYERGLAVGRKTGRRIFLNFTGIFCSNCRTMEAAMFPRPRVREALSKMVLVDLVTDLPSDEAGVRNGTHTTAEMSRRYQELRRKPPPEGYGTTANPHYVILAPDGTRLAQSGYEQDEEAFLRFLGTGAD